MRLIGAALIWLVLLTPAWAANNYDVAILARSSLQAYWRLNNTAGCTSLTDSGPNAYTLTVVGTVTCGSTTLLKGGTVTSANFDGSTGYAKAANNTILDNDGTQAFTVEALITGPADNSEHFLFAKGTATQGIQIGFFNKGPDIYMQGTGGIIHCDSFNLANGGVILVPGEIYHIAVTYDGSKSGSGIYFFLNGAQYQCQFGGSFTGSSANTAVLNIAQRNNNDTGSNFWAGRIEEVSYDNVALTPATIAADAKTALFNGTTLQADLPYPVRVLFDQDAGEDAGNEGAHAVLLQYAINGKATIVGMVTSCTFPYSGAVTYVINNYYGYPSIPIGPYTGATGNCGVDAYASQVSTDFGYHHPNTDTAYFPYGPNAVIRATLCAQPDNSVVWYIGGAATNLANFLQAGAGVCGGNTYTGAQVVQHKVYRLINVAGRYPSVTAGEFNDAEDPVAASYIAANINVESVGMSQALNGTVPTSPPAANVNPVLDAYVVSGSSGGRPSWDQVGMVAAVEGMTNSGWFSVQQIAGSLSVSSFDGSNSYTQSTPGFWASSYVNDSKAVELTAHIQALMEPAIPPPARSGGLGLSFH